MNIRTVFVVVVALLTTMCAFSQGTVLYDQASFSGPITLDGTFAIQPGQPVGQSFTPSLNAVGFVNLLLLGGGTGGTVTMDIMSSSINGPVIGTSASVTIGPSSSALYTFNFDSVVSVVPGTTYYFRPIVSPANSNILTPSVTGYAGGTGYYMGNPTPLGGDLEFQEGIYAPEPSTFVLLAVGAGALIWMRRSKQQKIADSRF